MAIWANFVQTTINSAVSIGASSIVVDAATAPFNTPIDPSGETAYLVLSDNLTTPTAYEVITYTGRTGTGPYTLTGVTKGQEGTADQAWSAADFVAQSHTAASVGRIQGVLETSGESIELGKLGSGDRYAYIDFHGDDTNTDFADRLIRANTGENADFTHYHVGTGAVINLSYSASDYEWWSGGYEVARLSSAGTLTLEQGGLIAKGDGSQYPAGVVIQATTHVTSERAGALVGDWQIGQDLGALGTKDFYVYSGDLARAPLYIDTAGNAGIGNSALQAWDSAYTALQLGGNGVLMSQTTEAAGNYTQLSHNAYYDGAWKYISTDEATMYYQGNGAHGWRVAASGTADTAITWIDALTIGVDGNIGGGTTSPDGSLHVVRDGASSTIRNDAYGASANPGFQVRKSRGTVASPTALLSDDLLGGFYWSGNVNTTPSFSNGASVEAYTTEAWSSGNAGAELRFSTVPNGTGARSVAMTIANDGNVGIDVTAPDEALDVNGAICIVDGMTAPATHAGKASLYIDTADGDLKIKFGDGTVKTITVDT